MKVKDILQKKNLIESFFSLSFINFTSMILPFISLPYMLRIIGKSYYGVYSYIYVIEEYVLLFTSFGFIYTATRDISQNRNNILKIKQIYTSVCVCKLLILLLVLFFVFLIHPILFHSHLQYKLFVAGLGIVVGDILMPTHLYQGLERMKYLTIINIIPKLIFTILIFIVVKEPSDYVYIIVLNSLGYLVAGLCSTLIASKYLRITFCKISYDDIKYHIFSSFSVFASNIGISLYRNANVLILGMSCSDAIVGIYAAAEKIVKAIQSTIAPITQALFPHVSLKFKTMNDPERTNYLKSLIKYISPILIIIVLVTIIFSPFISNLILGSDFSSSIPLIKIMSLVIFFGTINYILGFIGLVNINKGRYFFKNVIFAGLLNVIITLTFVEQYSYYAAAFAVIITEFFLSCLCVRTIQKLTNKI